MRVRSNLILWVFVCSCSLICADFIRMKLMTISTLLSPIHAMVLQQLHWLFLVEYWTNSLGFCSRSSRLAHYWSRSFNCQSQLYASKIDFEQGTAYNYNTFSSNEHFSGFPANSRWEQKTKQWPFSFLYLFRCTLNFDRVRV